MSYQVSSSGKLSIVKDPNAVLDYSIDLVDWLEGDTVVHVEAITEGVAADSTFINGTVVGAIVSGGEEYEPAFCTLRFATALGRFDDRTIHFKIKNR